MVKKISEEEQRALREKAKTELLRINKVMDEKDTQQKIEAFKSKFTTCEIVYKVVLKTHQMRTKGECPDVLKIHLTQVKNALNFAGYDFDYTLLNNIFGSEEKVGVRSAKKIRDALTHKMPQSAVDELISRWKELNSYMDSFLQKIESFDT